MIRRDWFPGAQGMVDDTGEVVRPDWFYATPQRRFSLSDPLDRQTVVMAGPAQTHTLEHAHIASMPWRVRTNIPATGFDNWWVLANDVGQSFLASSNSREVESGEFSHNPTHGGAIMEPNRLLNFNNSRSSGADRWIRPSPSLHSRVFTDGIEVVSEGAVIPLEFETSGFPTVVATAGHQGDEETVALFWRMRQFQQLRLNYQGTEGRHRFVMWEYDPRPWTARDGGRWPSPGLLRSFSSGFAWDNQIGGPTTAFAYDPVTRTRTDLGVDWSANTALQIQFFTDRTAWTGDVVKTDPAATSSGYLAVYLVNAAATFAVGIFARIHDSSPKLFRPMLHQLVKFTNPPGNSLAPFAGGQLTLVNADNLNRRNRDPGWVGHHLWIVTAGTQAQFEAEVDAMFADRVADLETPFIGCVPDHVWRGTDPPRTVSPGAAGAPGSRIPSAI